MLLIEKKISKKTAVVMMLICLASCMSKSNEETKSVFDSASLKTFVLSARTINEVITTKQLDSVLTNASKDSTVFRQTITFLETPFSNPNSSYRNQNLYSKLLEAEIGSNWYSAYEKEIAVGKLKLLQQNNVGNPANDFTYTTPAGYKKRMYDVKADHTLIYFYNPECNACKEMREALVRSEVIGLNVKTGRLKVLAMYIDKDEKLWLDHLSEYPGSWIQGRDENEYLYRNKIYDLRAIPTIYLLDTNKKVLLKDCTDVRAIEEKL